VEVASVDPLGCLELGVTFLLSVHEFTEVFGVFGFVVKLAVSVHQAFFELSFIDIIPFD